MEYGFTMNDGSVYYIETSGDGKTWSRFATRDKYTSAIDLAEKVSKEDGVYARVIRERASFAPTKYVVSTRLGHKWTEEASFTEKSDAIAAAANLFVKGMNVGIDKVSGSNSNVVAMLTQ